MTALNQQDTLQFLKAAQAKGDTAGMFNLLSELLPGYCGLLEVCEKQAKEIAELHKAAQEQPEQSKTDLHKVASTQLSGVCSGIVQILVDCDIVPAEKQAAFVTKLQTQPDIIPGVISRAFETLQPVSSEGHGSTSILLKGASVTGNKKTVPLDDPFWDVVHNGA